MVCSVVVHSVVLCSVVSCSVVVCSVVIENRRIIFLVGSDDFFFRFLHSMKFAIFTDAFYKNFRVSWS